MRYYDLDINGKVKGSYAVPQPGKELTLLKIAPDNESMWDGEKWVPDQDLLATKQSIKDAEDAEILIQAKIRGMAIEALEKEGKLDKNGKVIK